jgi:hypothetical protein
MKPTLIRQQVQRVYAKLEAIADARRRPLEFRSVGRNPVVVGARWAVDPGARGAGTHDAASGSSRGHAFVAALDEQYAMDQETIDRTGFERCFPSCHPAGRLVAFLCDAQGLVDLDALGRQALNNYLYARAVVGREFRMPRVRAVGEAAGAGLR